MEDEAIVQLFWERAESAVAEASNKYGAYCRAIAVNILASRQDAEECENDTYVAAWNAIPPTRPRRLKTFLGRLTRNIALDRYDYNRAKKRNSEFDLLLSELEECVPAKNAQPDEGAEEVAGMISDFLRTADMQSRHAFVRRYWYSDSVKDIAARLKISESKTKSMLFRTRGKLRLYLEQRGVEL